MVSGVELTSRFKDGRVQIQLLPRIDSGDYQVEVSNDMRQWTALVSGEIDGSVVIIDESDGTSLNQFYRLRVTR